MIAALLKKFSGNHYRRFVKKARPVVQRINELEQSYQSLSDEQLKAKTPELMARYAQTMAQAKEALGGERADPNKLLEISQRTLDDMLPEAFAVAKNAARRLCGQQIEFTGTTAVWNMVYFDVQLMGGMALHDNKIAEMATGEGKTFVATLPLYLNALSGRNCQLVTVNEYLAQRDAEWMGHLYRYLGLTVGVIKSQQSPQEKSAAYGCNITYGTSSEFGFDYLRDNGMATRSDDQVQREHYYCIVDEIDSILIDEARTPLIISGPVQEDREAPFRELKGGVANLVNAQNRLCNKLVTEAKDIFDKKDATHEEQQLALTKMLQVKLGFPKNRILLRLLEQGDVRNAFERYHTEMHSDFNKKILYALKEELFYVIDERQHQADLTEAGRAALSPNDPDAFVLPDLPTAFMEIDRDSSLSDEEKAGEKQKEEAVFSDRSEKIHCISQLLRAYSLYEKDKEYVVSEEGKIVIIDENTGRPMAGRRWSEGLHQAVEAKEGVDIQKESKTFATITIQNYFRLYDKLAGMTGTAETEAQEFNEIYGLDVMAIPTNKPCIRIDDNDVIYKTRREKFNAVVDDVAAAYERGQPVLVGTTSVQASEVVGKLLSRRKIPHNVLNAKFHQQEAEIVAHAGQKGAVMVATNMAGRGTDIKLGQGVPELGGLLVLGTERHESRRIDRQLRGRCSRQGDPGHTKFYVSLEDDLMRLFANAGPIARILQSSFKEGEVLAHPLLNRSIGTAQKKVEQQNYSIRKRLLQYDDVLNRQREVIYGVRNDAIHSDVPKDIIFEMIEEELDDRLDSVGPLKDGAGEASGAFLQWVNMNFPVALQPEAIKGKEPLAVKEVVLGAIRRAYEAKEAVEDPELIRDIERYVIIRAIDHNWQDHLTEMEDLRRSVGLRGYGQKDPLIEYKGEAYTFFQDLMRRVRGEICTGLFRSASNLTVFQNMLARLQEVAKTSGPDEGAVAQGAGVGSRQPVAAGVAAGSGGGTQTEVKLPKVAVQPVQRELPKIGRNDVVTIRRGSQTQTLKFKKAEALLREEGWVLIDHKPQ